MIPEELLEHDLDGLSGRVVHQPWGPKKLYIVLGRVLAGDQVPGVRTI